MLKHFFWGILFVLASGLFLPVHAKAYFVRETEPGILEMRGVSAGSLIVDNVHLDKRRGRIYFSVHELNSSSEPRYFYADVRDNRVMRNDHLQSIQFGLEKRIFNSRGRIPMGKQRYFYPVVLFEKMRRG